MGSHFDTLTKAQLHALFSGPVWESLSFQNKLDACQEVENRYAAENGVPPCTVKAKNMLGATSGYQYKNTIALNKSLLQDGTFLTEFTDFNGNSQRIKTKALAPGWNTLDTIYHEGTHGIQAASGRMPQTYITGETDQDLYRIQEVEKEAFAVGQWKTLDAMSNVEHLTGAPDPSRSEYLEYVKMDSFQSALDASVLHYNDPDIEQTLHDVIRDRDYGITRFQASDSYQAIRSLCDRQYFRSHESVQAAADFPSCEPAQTAADFHSCKPAQAAKLQAIAGGNTKGNDYDYEL